MSTLTLKRAADVFPDVGWPRTDTDWAVLAEGRVVGIIRQIVGGPSDGAWFWSLNGLGRPQKASEHGQAPTLDAAKAAFRQAWEAAQGPETKKAPG